MLQYVSGSPGRARAELNFEFLYLARSVERHLPRVPTMTADRKSEPDANEKPQRPADVSQHENNLENPSSEIADFEQGNEYQDLQLARLEQQVQSEGIRRTLLRARLSQAERRLAEQSAE